MPRQVRLRVRIVQEDNTKDPQGKLAAISVAVGSIMHKAPRQVRVLVTTVPEDNTKDPQGKLAAISVAVASIMHKTPRQVRVPVQIALKDSIDQALDKLPVQRLRPDSKSSPFLPIILESIFSSTTNIINCYSLFVRSSDVNNLWTLQSLVYSHIFPLTICFSTLASKIRLAKLRR